MATEKKKDFFWLSYSDLMTSLFFVMLVLFVLIFTILNNKISELEIQKDELERIKKIEATVNNIDTNYFKYDEINKKHILNMQFLFPVGSPEISKIVPDKRKELLKAGETIKDLIKKFPEEENIKYLIVVEGQASLDHWPGNEDLSFHRAQSLIKFWEQNNIGLDKLKNCEIIIAGSGEKGIPRDTPDIGAANQRFLITIIPKIGQMKKKNQP